MTARSDTADRSSPTPEYVLVPRSALEWLNGSGPDAHGNWFGDGSPPSTRPFWWRSHFAELLAAAPPSAGGVKGLEWKERLDQYPRWAAESVVGEYRIDHRGPNDYRLWLLGGDGWGHDCETLDAAKAAAQADFGRRIQSCLVSPAPIVDAGTEALRRVQSWVQQERIALGPLDPDFMPKHSTLKAVGKKLRDEIAALSSPSPAPAEDVWLEMASAPRDAREIILRIPCQGLPDHYAQIGHWAEDTSGEEQPPFRGWFRKTGFGCAELPEPTGWTPLVPFPTLEAERAKTDAAKAEAEEAHGRLRMIVGHATAGQTDGAGMSVNDVCVAITALRNELWLEARKKPEAALAKALQELAEGHQREQSLASDLAGVIEDTNRAVRMAAEDERDRLRVLALRKGLCEAELFLIRHDGLLPADRARLRSSGHSTGERRDV